MKTETFDIAGLVALTPDKFGDARGFFSETWNARAGRGRRGRGRVRAGQSEPVTR